MRINQESFMVDREDAKPIAEQLKFEWLIENIQAIGLDLDGCIPDSGRYEDRSVDQIVKLRDLISQNKLVIQEDDDNNTVIYSNGELIGQWNKPTFILHHDHSIIDKRKRFYTEIIIQHWSFKDQIEEKND